MPSKDIMLLKRESENQSPIENRIGVNSTFQLEESEQIKVKNEPSFDPGVIECLNEEYELMDLQVKDVPLKSSQLPFEFSQVKEEIASSKSKSQPNSQESKKSKDPSSFYQLPPQSPSQKPELSVNQEMPIFNFPISMAEGLNLKDLQSIQKQTEIEKRSNKISERQEPS